ncbi:hypothetical protein PRIPAC_83993 [Pristionchus pacificus]|uniref:Uncharacterized protein n=1 Tax=Pristionchus pacificus TaxID=54126 RepID=A0A2A6BTJ6_PRIPA|nr:hypothetical protein PRIPAC_83993 [Pristionchus pacificus]|eukprot:PDM69187.1 hypothetical protein PRIPAC_47489 [Pristionchus pacificus]
MRKTSDIRIMVLGESGVGKTCILNRFADDTFDSTWILTIGIDCKVRDVNINGKMVKLQLW